MKDDHGGKRRDGDRKIGYQGETHQQEGQLDRQARAVPSSGRRATPDSAAFARRTGILFDETGILWFRGYVQSNTLTSELEGVLEEFGTEIHVVAHTPVSTLESRYDGKLLAVDLERPATEMLLLVRSAGDDGYDRWRVGLNGPPEPF
ncbi:MAG: hypothetical protein IH921_14210 [Gemmatimonadetes bacterium]|nr:hypothetical protein [Gemmatimonadota bacterium]